MKRQDHTHEGRRSAIGSAFLVRLYGMIRHSGFRAMLRRVALKLEGGAMLSLTVREVYRLFHGLEVGLYTIGPCETGPEQLDPGTTIGRYSSIYYTVRTVTRDYPMEANPDHGLFFMSALGKGWEASPRSRLIIGSDVFIGHNVVILPSTGQIGDGAVIGAGSIVQAPVPPFAVVTGNPARVVRYRFSEPTIRRLLEEQWWRRSIVELSSDLEEFRRPLEHGVVK